MSGHTPGPWRIDVIAGGYIYAKPNTAHAAKYPKNKWVQVGHVCTFAECSAQEAFANLSLLAAAPDLLAALRDLMPLMAECDCIYSDRQAPLCPCRAARAAILKATGET